MSLCTRVVALAGAGLAAASWALLVSVALAQPAFAQPAQETVSEGQRQFAIAPSGYVQLDWRGYPDWELSTGTGRLEHDTFNVRRLRVGLAGHWRRLDFEVTLDPQDWDGTLVKDAYAELRLGGQIRLQAGQFKLPGPAEYHTSARRLDFMERAALASSIAPGRDLGAMLVGRLGRMDYQAGMFAGDGNGRPARADLTAAWSIRWNAAANLEAGGSFSLGRTSPTDSEPANGLEGRSASGYRFFERVYVHGRRVRLGADVRWEPGRWRLSAAWLRAHDERSGQGLEFEDLPGVRAIGWSAAVTRKFGRGNASPRWREWDLGLRVDGQSFDDDGPATASDSVRPRATDVRAKAAQRLTAAGSWSPRRWTRVIAEGAVERFDDSRSAPRPGRRGPYWTFGTRMQFELP
jgi:hypothetical protein